jgi:hypothetical protein
MARSDKEKKEIYDKWKGLINMSQDALDEWAKNPARLEASLNRAKAKDEGGIQSGLDSLHRIKRRKSKPVKEWSDVDFDNAAQENGFNGRMLGGKIGQPVGSTGMSKWEISLRNWGHDPALSSSSANSKYKAWKKSNKDAIMKSKAKAKKTGGSISIRLPVWENGRVTRQLVVSNQYLWEWTGRKFENVEIRAKKSRGLLRKDRIFFTDLQQGVKWLKTREKVAKEATPKVKQASVRVAYRFLVSKEKKPEATNQKLWDKMIQMAKGELKSVTEGGKTVNAPNEGKGFNKYPSAYANGWALAKYKELGGGWK